MVTGVAESVLALGCLKWAYQRCAYNGAYDSDSWAAATPEEFSPIPRICRLLLAVYEEDLSNPQFPPDGGYRLNPEWVVKRVDYDITLGYAPPYFVYVDHENREIVLTFRGLNMGNQSDYKVLLNNRLGMQMFDGGYVHHGLLKSAIWVFNQELDTIKRLWMENKSSYDIVFAGHSLGSGVAAMLTVIAVNHRDQLGGVPRNNIRCYAAAPVRCMSLNLAVKYADVIHSVVLQDDFLPRTPTPLEDMFQSVFCLPCLLFTVCITDTFIPESRKLADPRRLYAPGRMYHIVERKCCSCRRHPPEVRTAIPIDGRFEHVVLSCNATSDHAIIWIEREAEKALHIMKEKSPQAITTAPRIQRLERLQTLERERIVTFKGGINLQVPQYLPSSDNDSLTSKEELRDNDDGTKSLDRVTKKFYKRDESGELLLKRHEISPR